MGPEYDRILSTFEEWLRRRRHEHYEACKLCHENDRGNYEYTCQYALALEETEKKLTNIWTTIA